MTIKRYIFQKIVAITILSLIMQGENLLASGIARDFRDKYRSAKELYQQGIKESAYQLFSSAMEGAVEAQSPLASEIHGYMTLISIESQYPVMDGNYRVMEQLYSSSSLINLVRVKYAGVLFDNREYSQALEVYNKINPSRLHRNYRNEYHFKKGYSHFRTGEIVQALELMTIATKGEYDNYTNVATYYLAHTHYVIKEFEQAVSFFEKILHDPRFSTLSRYYILESKFMMGNHNYVVTQGEALYNELEGDMKNKSARLVSESFFALDNTDKARFYFERYSLSQGSLTRSELYYAAILAYSQSNYPQAIDLFKQATSQNDSLSQNAFYHLGRCYIEMKNKLEALNSFKEASEGDFDSLIKEDALFNYAKLSFDLNSDISQFQNYLNTYSPIQSKYNEIQNYIANSYLVNQDYRGAIEVMKNIKNPSPYEIVNFQKATFLRGMQLIDLGAYRDAIPLLELSIKNGEFNNNLYNVTRFWLAEAYYRNNQFNESVEINLDLTTRTQNFRASQEFSTASYNLAYGYFKLGNFTQSEAWFKSYLNLPKNATLYYSEAICRLGDSYYMQRKYEDAKNSYSLLSANNTSHGYYARFQNSIVTGLLGDDNTKSKMLIELAEAGEKRVSKTLYPQVLYELGRTLIQTGKSGEATKYLTQLSEEYSTTNFYPKALLELGLIELNLGNNNNAIKLYKQILQESPQSPEAQSAIAGLENIYKDMGRAQEFLSYIDEIGLSQTRTTSERESIVFSSAENLFLSGNYTGAINSLNSFLKSYPDGVKNTQAWFYLGESYLKISKPELAMDAFLKVMEIGQGSFTELSTLNYARISYNLQNYKQAANAYQSLARIAQLENNIIEAQVGLMNSYFMDKQYRNAIAQAERTLEVVKSGREEIRSIYILAKSYYTLGERDKAINYLNKLAVDKISAEGAESAYLIISDVFDQGDFAQVEKMVYDFADSRTPQTYWLAKSYILLGDTFAERENWEQAEATYKSILESYKSESKDDIEEQIKMRLSKIEEIKRERDENR